MITRSFLLAHPTIWVVLAAAFFLASCGEAPSAVGGAKGGKSGKGGGAAPVLVAEAERKIVPLSLEAIGAVEPMRTTTIRSQVTGALKRRVAREGQDVAVGDLLLEVDARPFLNAVLTAEADLRKAQVQLATALAREARYRGLSNQQMVSKEEFERITDTARGRLPHSRPSSRRRSQTWKPRSLRADERAEAREVLCNVSRGSPSPACRSACFHYGRAGFGVLRPNPFPHD
jgi:multidrug efflux system membrane fusion protein